MDTLSDVLSLLRVNGAVSSRFEGRGAWAFRFPAYQHIKFGTVLSGAMHLWIEGETSKVRVEEGDFFLLTNGMPFRSASNPACAPLDGPAVYRSIRAEDGVVRYSGPGDGELVSMTSGRFIFENDVADIFLKQLPPLIHLRAADVASHTLGSVLELLRSETGAVHPGTEVAKGSLAALVLVHVLRAYVASTDQPKGWLSALSDARIGPALSLMHAKPAERWTVGGLASAVGMSRTAFAMRFHRAVGCAPLDYLNQWRMTIARTALLHSDAPLVDIAARTGYLSDTAFSAAFKRWTGQSPARYRAAHRQ
jgi:AraC-like DNA-binding protein